ncbi:homoserine kinase [Tumidithrix helvetica PCC 7403]|uniref:homoserine kinase n=1 Tax=Tumidithrix helvetica TaxID=3457545 RepID=UPI003CC1020C
MFEVSVPATTGNLGPGFDCLGAALSLYNKFQFAVSDELKITASGAGADKVAKNKSNLVYESLEKFYAHIGQPKPIISLHIDAQVPLARGLGSSATAIVGGLVGANLLAGSPLDQKDLLQLAIDMEGHPDNVVPAMLGGCYLMASNKSGGWEFCPINWHKQVAIAIAIPNFELSTAKARQVLPRDVPMKDAIFNASHLALLTHALTTGNQDWLQSGLQDRLHQPYRQSLIPGMEAVQKATIEAGAYGMVISGAGPTLLALGSPAKIEAVAEAMRAAWQETGMISTAKCLAIAKNGTTITG